jgi:hypothetical protein
MPRSRRIAYGQTFAVTKLVKNSGFSNWEPVALRQRAQLLQREPTASAGCRYRNPGPYALRTRRLTSFLSAFPTAGACAAQRFGAFVGHRRPPVWIPRTYDCRDPRVLHPVRPSLIADNMAVLYQRYRHIVDRAEYDGPHLGV